MTYKVPGLQYKMPTTFVEISPQLAEERDIHEGAAVKLISETGEATVHVHVTDRVKGKQIYLPLNDNSQGAINYLTSSVTDPETHTPAYKSTCCRMEVLSQRGKSPLNPTNFRNQTRHPQYSVRVDKKWARPDYVFPGDQVMK